MERFTHLGRVIDLRYGSNRLAVAAAAAGSLVYWLRGGAVTTSLLAGVAVFLSWALGRELDPDHTTTAGLAAAATLVTMALLTPPVAAGAVYLVMVASRMLVRSTGLAPTLGDVVVQVAIGVWLSASPAGWLGALAVAMALTADAADTDPAAARYWGWALGVAATLRLLLTGDVAWSLWSGPVWLWIPVIAGLAAVRVRSVTSTGDFTPETLSARRVTAARLLTVLAVAVAMAIGAGQELAPAAMASAATVVGGRLQRRRRGPAPVV